MNYYSLKLGKLERKLPIVSLTPKIKVASFNLLGDQELVSLISRQLAKRLKEVNFDYLVGPEVKVVPLLHELSKILKKDRYVVCRKQIHGYMISPLKSDSKNGLVLNGPDAEMLNGKRVVIVDDVVTTGSSIHSVEQLMKSAGAFVVGKIAIFKQGNHLSFHHKELVYLSELPVFSS